MPLPSPWVLQGVPLFPIKLHACLFHFSFSFCAYCFYCSEGEGIQTEKNFDIFMYDFIWDCKRKMHMENWFAYKLTAHLHVFSYKHFVEKLQLDRQSNLQCTSGSTTSFAQAVSCQHPSTLLLSFSVRKWDREGGKCFSLSHVLLELFVRALR